MEEKSSPSDKLYNTIALASAGLSLFITIVYLVTYFIHHASGLAVFRYAFYPIVILVILSLIFGVNELIRNRYFTSILSVCISLLVLAITVTVIILQGVYLGKVYIVPFIFL